MLPPRIVSALAAVLLFAAAGPAAAQDQQGGNPLVMAVLDYQQVQERALVAKHIREEIAKRTQSFETEMQAEDKALREANQELARQRSVLSPEAFKAERQKFEERFLAAQRKVQQRRGELEEARNAALLAVQKELKEIISGFVRKHGLTVIFRSEQLVFHDKDMDITDAVIAELDRRLPKVQVFGKK